MASPTRAELLSFLRSHPYATEASVSALTGVQAAVVGIAVLDNFEIVFDTLSTSRKARNLERDPRIAFVIGGFDGREQSVQYEGRVDKPADAELRQLQEEYFRVFPDGRDRLAWPELIHLRARPRWLRYSDYSTTPPLIIELSADDFAAA